uniref:Uncharacterized protein n=1 Tax=Rhizophora mucronata TaxID=61149 RepID=A0A2P2R1I4_RHIMU
MLIKTNFLTCLLSGIHYSHALNFLKYLL